MILLAACTLSRTEAEACSDDAACRAAFGAGSTCGSEGWCTEPALDAACTQLGDDMLGTVAPSTSLVGLDPAGADGPVGHALTLASRERPEVGDAAVHAAVCTDVDGVDAAARALGAQLLIGAETEAEARALLTTAWEVDSVVLSPSATADALTLADGTTAEVERFWRTVGADTTEGLALVDGLLQAGHADDAVLLLHADQGAPDDIADAFAQGWTTGGGSRLSYADYADGAVADALAARDVAEPAVIVLAASDLDEVGSALSALASDTRLSRAEVWATSVAYDAALFTRLDEDGAAVLTRMRGVGRPSPDPVGGFSSRWMDSLGGEPPDSTGARAYDAAWLGLYAVYGTSVAGGTGGSGTAAALGRLSAGETVDVGPDGWSAGSAALAAGSIDLRGVSSAIDFDDHGDILGELLYWRVEGGSDFAEEGRWPS